MGHNKGRFGRALPRRVVIAVVAACAATGVSVPLLATANPKPDPSAEASSKALEQPGFKKAEKAERERLDKLRTPEEKARRAESRTAFKGLDGAEARRTAREHFPEQIAGKLYRAEEVAPGFKLHKVLDKGGAIVKDEKSDRTLFVQSTLPFETMRDGRKVPVDLSLVERDGVVESEAAIVPARLRKQRPAFDFGAGTFGLELETAGSPGEGVLSPAGRLFFDNAQADTDAVLKPVPLGVEISLQVRSPEAPELYTLNVDMPAGARLHRPAADDPDTIPGDPPRVVHVMQGKRVLGTVFPPVTQDADGVGVRSSIEIAGPQTITLKVEHRERDVRYPLLVDPETYYYATGSPCTATGWNGWGGWNWFQVLGAYQDIDGDGRADHFGAMTNNYNYWCGLYQSMPTRKVFNHGAYAEWYYRAPASTYVYRAILGNMGHNAYICSGSYSCSQWFNGISSPQNNYWEGPANYKNSANQLGPNPFGPATHSASGVTHDYCFQWWSCSRWPSGAGDANHVIFGLQAVNPYGGGIIYTGTDLADRAQNFLSSAQIFLGDRYAPTVGVPASTGWYNDSANRTHNVAVQARDTGLGLQQVTLSGPASATNWSHNASCYNDGYRASVCPTAWDPTFSYTLNEGETTVRFRALDLVDNWGPEASYVERIDRTNPTASFGGEMRPAGTGLVSSSTADLTITASDSVSGLSAVQLFVTPEGGTEVEKAAASASGGTWRYDFGTYQEGNHRLRVVIRDQAGNTYPQSAWNVVIDRNSPRITAGPTHTNLPAGWTKDATPTVTFSSADDASSVAAAFGSGVKDVRLLRGGTAIKTLPTTVTCTGTPSNRCPRTRANDAFTYNAASTTDFPTDGVHALSVQARDALPTPRTVDSATWQLKVDRTAPVPSATGTLRDNDGKAVGSAGLGLSISATDTHAGVKRMWVTVNNVDDTPADWTTQDCDACSMSRSYTFTPTKFGEGVRTVRVYSEDRAGNVSTALTYTVIVDLNAPRFTGITHSSLPAGWVQSASPSVVASATDLMAGAVDYGSGVTGVRLVRNGTIVDPRTFGCTGTVASRCPSTPAAQTFNYGTSLVAGVNTMEVQATDALRSAVGSTWQVKVDTDQPDATLGGTLLSGTGVYPNRNYTVSVAATDLYSGAKSIELTIDGTRAPNGFVERSCTANPGCSPTGYSNTFTVNTTGMKYGSHNLVVTVVDAVGRSRTFPRTFDVGDDEGPKLEITGGLRTFPVQTGRDLKVVATDAGAGMRYTEVFLQRLNEDGTVSGTESRVAYEDACPTLTQCPASRELNYTLPDGTATGLYRFRVKGTDAVGNPTEVSWRTRVVSLRSGSRSDLGLEQWFELEDTDAGGDGTVFVNGKTGNVVYHQTPIVNPSRGLSTVVNLTYNAHDRGGILGLDLGSTPLVGTSPDDDDILGNDLVGATYRQAGVGFSIGIAGPTRVNEPLGGVTLAGAVERTLASHDTAWSSPLAGRMTLTDADGTMHEFTRPMGATAWRPSPGLNMRLRYVGPRLAGGLLPATTAQLETDQVWELLRPDGVRHVFDRYGFIQKTTDRNGNLIDFVYDAVSPITGSVCASGDLIGAAQAAAGVCTPRLREVRSPTWNSGTGVNRRVRIDYEPTPTDAGSLLQGLVLSPGSATTVGWTGGRAPQISMITDAAQRKYLFEYHSSTGPLRGYLRQFTENYQGAQVVDQGEPVRVTRFAYDEAPATGLLTASIGDVQQLTSVVPVVGGTEKAGTVIAYQPRGSALVRPAPRKSDQLTKRNGAPKLFRYTAAASGRGALFNVHERVSGARHLSTQVELDDGGRPKIVRSSSTDRSGETFTPVASQGTTETQLTWNPTENKVGTLVEAAGTAAARTTTYAYATTGSGAITMRSVTGGGQTRTWTFGQYSDRENGFIADPQSLSAPGGRNWTFEVDALGNERFRTDPDGVRTQIDYGAGGVVVAAQDRMLRWTTFPLAEYHHTGLPQTVNAPTDVANPSRSWRYRYDDAGNVVQALDPRGTAVPGTDGRFPAGSAFLTSLTYDGFDRLVRENIPRCTGSSDCKTLSTQAGDADYDGPAFVQRTRKYDRNGNVTLFRDPTGAETTIEPDALDQPRTVTEPRAGGTATTNYAYDDAGRLIGEFSPRGHAGASVATVASTQIAQCETSAWHPQAHLQRFCLDHRGQPLATVEYSTRSGDQQTLVTSFAYDGRGNRTRVRDANRNAATATTSVTVPQAVTAVNAAGGARVESDYDLLDRVVAERVRPAESGAPLRERTYGYDVKGDLKTETVTDAAGPRVSRYDHDALGQVTRATDPLGRATCVRRQADGLVTAQTSPRGVAEHPEWCLDAPQPYVNYTTKFAYDAVGDLLERTIPHRDAPGGTAPGITWKVTYARDAVGNPKTITDGRGNAFDNRFYDTGELRETGRPSWWDASWEGEQDNPEAGDRYQGAAAADVTVATGGPSIREAGLRTRTAADSDSAPEKPQSLGHGDLGAVAPQGLPGLLPDAGSTKLRYDAAGRLARVVDAAGRFNRISYDPVGRVAAKSWPLNATTRIDHAFTYDLDGNLDVVTEDWLPSTVAKNKVVTSFGYDGYGRRISETTDGAHPSSVTALDDLDEKSEFGFDFNGNVLKRTTPRGTAFNFTYDSLDQLKTEANPAGQTWEYDYDRHGSRTLEIAPGGRDASRTKQLFTTNLAYDAAGQLKTRTRHLEGSSGPRPVLESFGYDADGNPDSFETPGAPSRVLTTIEHDPRGLPWRTTVRKAGSSVDDTADRRVSITEYDPNGNLRRQVNPAGINATTRLPIGNDDGGETSANLTAASQGAMVFSYSKDDLKLSERMPWDWKRTHTGALVKDANGNNVNDGRYLRKFERNDAVGRLTALRLPHPVDAETVWRTYYSYNDAGWVTSASDATRTPRADRGEVDPSFHYEYDQRGNQTRWRSKNAKASDAGRVIRWSHWPNGLLKTRTATKLKVDGTDETPTTRTYDYLYNRNRSLVRMVDVDANRLQDGKQRRVTTISRDVAERETRIDEDYDAGDATPAQDRRGDSLVEYDAFTGDILKRHTDGNFDPAVANPIDHTATPAPAYLGASKKVSTFTYDPFGREKSMSVVEAGRAARVTTTTWHDGGQMDSRTKSNDTREVWKWDVLGQKTGKDRFRRNVTTPETQTYTYDVNGNRTGDERGTHAFNARNQLIWWKRSSTRGRADRRGWITGYELNGSGATVRRTEDDDAAGVPKVESDSTFDGDRLLSTTTVDRSGTLEQKFKETYRYDDAGNVQRIYTQDLSVGTLPPPEPADTALSPTECEADDTTTTRYTRRYCYDEFFRQVFASGQGVDRPALITFDGLDRRDTKTVKLAGQPTERRDYSYVGTSELLTSEAVESGVNLQTKNSHTYDYDSRGDRQGQSTDAGADYRVYAKDANGSVTGLEAADGTLSEADSYDYDPYGSLDRKPTIDPDDPEEGLSAAAKGNPFRFEGFYYDSGVKTYDMHARQYRPDIGRFLSKDLYASAAGDQALQADPLTQNRYAFAGGNPVTNVEFDGHCVQAGATGGPCLPMGPKPNPRVQKRAFKIGAKLDRVARNANDQARAVEVVAKKVVHSNVCMHGELCSDRQEAKNTEALVGAMLMGEDPNKIKFDVMEFNTDVGFWDPFNFLVGGVTTSVARTGLSYVGKKGAALTGLFGGSAANAADRALEAEIINLLVQRSSDRLARATFRGYGPVARRVKLRESTKKAIRDNTPKTPDGDYIDDVTGEIIPKGGPFHYGHRRDFEWRRTRVRAALRGWTRRQVIEWENNPAHYKIESTARNLGHQGERPGYWGPDF